MDCPRCGRKMAGGWNFCPFCGFRPDRGGPVFGGAFGGVFNSLMKRLSKQMEEIDKQFDETSKSFDQDFQVMDISPFFRDSVEDEKKFRVIGKPHATGFTIRIAQSGDRGPKVDVKTFGEIDQSMQRQISDQLGRMGIKAPAGPGRPGFGPAKPGPAKAAPEKAGERPTALEKRRLFRRPKVTEEPKTEIKQTGYGVAVDMEMPGVKSEDDVQVSELESSVEVRAMAGDKAYFKILTKPGQYSLRRQEFAKGRLHLEFG